MTLSIVARSHDSLVHDAVESIHSVTPLIPGMEWIIDRRHSADGVMKMVDNRGDKVCLSHFPVLSRLSGRRGSGREEESRALTRDSRD